jgi:uncharacterized Zn-binding protein involved in type VI secretion
MSKNVFANGMAIAGQAGAGKVIAAFPDVCMSPPPPPAGPLPVPYPDSSFSKDLKSGSSTVKIGGKPAALRDQSFFKTSPLGNEASTKNFGASVITHVNAGKTYFRLWSFDVEFEGKGVCRHLDLTTSNHASDPPGTPPIPEAETQALVTAGTVDETKCPCCGAPRHANQKDPVTGEPYAAISEADWYQKAVDSHNAKVQSMNVDIASNPSIVTTKAVAIAETLRKQKEAQDAMNTISAARKKSSPCPNLHDPPDTGCGTHFKKTNKKPNTSDLKERTKMGFNNTVRNESIRLARERGFQVTGSSPVAHKTPLSAGGCPSSQDNLIPNQALSPECQSLDEAQTLLQSGAALVWAP